MDNLYRVSVPLGGTGKGRAGDEICYEDVLVQAETKEGALLALSIALSQGKQFPGKYMTVNDDNLNSSEEVKVERIAPQVVVTKTGIEFNVTEPDPQPEYDDNVIYMFGHSRSFYDREVMQEDE